MKSLPNKSWDLREGTEIQSWRPDEIFPSLISEDIDSAIDEMLQMFQQKKKEDQQSEQQTSDAPVAKKKTDVKKWGLEELTNVVEQKEEQVSISGLQGTPVRLAQDDHQRLIAESQKQAEETIRNAQQTAREIISKAQEDAKLIRREAYNEGRAEGSTGLQKASENAQMILDQMNSWRQELIKHSENLVAEMIKKMARLMFSEGISLENEVLQHNLNRVMKMAESLGDLRIYLNPADAHILDPEWRKFQEMLTAKKIQIIPSDTVLPGGCYVQGELGIVDARVETQLQTVLDAVEQERQKAEDGI